MPLQIANSAIDNAPLTAITVTFNPANITLPQAYKQTVAEIQLITPVHEATIRNTQGQVHISWQAHSQADVTYAVYLDNNLRKITKHTSLALTDVERGAHSIYLQAKDKNGKVIAVSPTHTIYVHQSSKLFR